MTAGKRKTIKRNAPDEYRRITVEIDLMIPLWVDIGFDDEPIANVCRAHDADYPWRIADDADGPELREAIEQDFSAQLQEQANREFQARAEDRRDFRGMSEDEYMERLRERRAEK